MVVISGRTEGIDTVRRDQPELPLLRFVERPLVRYHGVELVTEVELSAGTDLYLADHLLDGNLLLPGRARHGGDGPGRRRRSPAAPVSPRIEDVEFLRPIVVPPDGQRPRIRIAALVTDDRHRRGGRSAARRPGSPPTTSAPGCGYGGAGVPHGPPDQVADEAAAGPARPGRRPLRRASCSRAAGSSGCAATTAAAARHVDAEVVATEPTATGSPASCPARCCSATPACATR